MFFFNFDPAGHLTLNFIDLEFLRKVDADGQPAVDEEFGMSQVISFNIKKESRLSKQLIY